MSNQSREEVLTMAVDRSDVCEKLKNIGDIRINWVSGDKQRKDFKVAVELLAMEVGQQKVDPTVLAVLDNFAGNLSVYLKYIDQRACDLHREMMDALPKSD